MEVGGQSHLHEALDGGDRGGGPGGRLGSLGRAGGLGPESFDGVQVALHPLPQVRRVEGALNLGPVT